jgi:hypothetical protein
MDYIPGNSRNFGNSKNSGNSKFFKYKNLLIDRPEFRAFFPSNFIKTDQIKDRLWLFRNLINILRIF